MQTEDELFSLARQILALTQTMMCSSEEDQGLASLQEWEDWLIRAKDLQKISKAQQGLGLPESDLKGSKQEAPENVEQHWTLGRKKTPSLQPNPHLVVASVTTTAESEPALLWPSPEGDTNWRGDVSTSPMLEDPAEESSPTPAINSLVPVVEASQEDARVETKEAPPFGPGNRMDDSHLGGTIGMSQTLWKEAWSEGGGPDPKGN